jgi:Family of unknown function (DUF6295)
VCTTIGRRVAVSGSGKGSRGWFPVDRAYLGYDHPFHADAEHALNIDFVNEAAGPDARVAVELTRETARELALKILTTLDEADAYEARATVGGRARGPVGRAVTRCAR